MIGIPKFKYGDKVTFKLTENLGVKEYEGTIYIIDKWGTFEQNEQVSYDIMVEDADGKQCLFKHITENLIETKTTQDTAKASFYSYNTACEKCGNNPSNGGSGICFCTLGHNVIY